MMASQVSLYLTTCSACLFIGLSSMVSLFTFSLFINRKPTSPGSRTTVINFDPSQSEILKNVLSFAVGSLLGDVFLHLLPEANVQLNQLGYTPLDAQHFLGSWTVMGIVLFISFESIFIRLHHIFKHQSAKAPTTTTTTMNGDPTVIRNGSYSNRSVDNLVHRATGKQNHDREPLVVKRPSQDDEKIHITGYLNLLANGFDNFTHGMAVGASFLVGYKTGMLTAMAIAIHEIPHEIADYIILIKSGFTSWNAFKAQMSISMVTMLGAVTVLLFDNSNSARLTEFTLWILPFTAGGFIYIAMSSLLPELLRFDEPIDECCSNGSSNGTNLKRTDCYEPKQKAILDLKYLLLRIASIVLGFCVMVLVNFIELS